MQYKPKITDNGVVLVEYLGMSPGWYPTYNDPDNSGCHPSAEPIYGQHLSTLPEHKDIWLSKEVWDSGSVEVRQNLLCQHCNDSGWIDGMELPCMNCNWEGSWRNGSGKPKGAIYAMPPSPAPLVDEDEVWEEVMEVVVKLSKHHYPTSANDI